MLLCGQGCSFLSIVKLAKLVEAFSKIDVQS